MILLNTSVNAFKSCMPVFRKSAKINIKKYLSLISGPLRTATSLHERHFFQVVMRFTEKKARQNVLTTSPYLLVFTTTKYTSI